jgi:DNA-binding CsgD family transcriptional regulator
MSDRDLEPIERKLNIILNLLARSLLPDTSQKDQIAFLSSLNLTPKEIAEIVDTTPNTVRVTLSRLRAQSN